MQRDGILVFAGYDPSGGAGILQDVHIIKSKGSYAFGIATSMVYENTCRLDSVYPLDIDMQINLALEEGIKFKIFKIGLVYSKRQLSSILTLYSKIKPVKIVIDPIFYSSTGGVLTRLLPEDYMSFIEKTNSVLMPNKEEYNTLFEDTLPQNAALKYKTDIILKSYKISNSEVMDLIVTKDGKVTEFKHKRLDTKYIHGTGCTISSLLSFYLLTYNDLKKAYMHAVLDFEGLILKTIRGGCQRIII